MNSKTAHLVLGCVLIVAAAVLLIGFRDAEFFWFTGQPLGVVLGIIGIFDLVDAARRSPSQQDDTA